MGGGMIMEDLVTFEIAKKLKEKGFNIPTKNIIAMYNELGVFHSLTTSADYETCDSGFKYRCYYNYDDFDDKDYIAPTISQVLKWLREKYFIHISTKPYPCEDGLMWLYEIRKFSEYIIAVVADKTGFTQEEQAALAGIKYVLNNLI